MIVSEGDLEILAICNPVRWYVRGSNKFEPTVRGKGIRHLEQQVKVGHLSSAT